MRIAVCLSGQPRTWRQCYDTWNFLFKELKRNENLRETDIEVDYFVHTWDFNSKPYSVWTRERYGIEGFQAPPSDHQTSDEILDYIKTIQPKQFLIESEAKSLSRKDEMDSRTQFRLNTTKWCPLSWASSQLYGIMMAGHLKRQYELDNGFKYDMCVRLRPDLYFNELNRRPSLTVNLFKAFCKPYFDDRLPGDAQSISFTIHGFNHPNGKVNIYPLLIQHGSFCF